jgi:peroxiredoxin
MAESHLPGKAKKIIYASLLIAGTVGAYQLGATWSGTQSSGSANASTAATTSAKKVEKAPKTIDFQLKDGIVNAWDLPPFQLKDTQGETHTLSDWKGKLILLNFWATWCPPCRYEIPEFIEYQNEYGKDGLQIIGIGIGEEKPIKNFARTFEMNYPVLITPDSALMQDWGNADQVLPYSVLINRDGRIQYIHRGQLTKLSFKYEIEPFIKQNEDDSKTASQ